MSDGTSSVSAWPSRSPKSSAESQRQAGMPKPSASFTKSGFVKSVPKCSPNFLSCFQTIEPYWLFSQITFTNAVPRRTAVSSSWQFMRKPPSPLTVTTLRSGWTSFAATGRRDGEAHPGEPVGDQHRVGLVGREHAADPQLVEADVRDQDVLAPERLADLVQRPRRLDRELVVVLRRLEAAHDDLPQPRRAALVGDVPALLA